MKTQQRLYTHALLFFLLTILSASCVGIFGKKDKDPEPELAGTYQMTQIVQNGQTISLPTSTISGNVSVTKPSDTTIKLTINSTINGRTKSDGPYDAEIRKASGAGYDIYDGNDRIGSIDGTNLTVDVDGYDAQGQYSRTVINAKK